MAPVTLSAAPSVPETPVGGGQANDLFNDSDKTSTKKVKHPVPPDPRAAFCRAVPLAVFFRLMCLAMYLYLLMNLEKWVKGLVALLFTL